MGKKVRGACKTREGIREYGSMTLQLAQKVFYLIR